MRIIPEKPCYITKSSCICHVYDGPCQTKMGQEPDYKAVITDANLRRRMGRLLKMSVSCGLETLQGVSPESVAGIITFTGMGFMKDTISFGDSIFDRGEELLNPSPFMQSTFNTASGYIALMKKIRAYNTTYVQQASGFSAAFADAVMLLEENPGWSVLVGGFDEITPEVDALRRRSGIYLYSPGVPMPLGEGCGFFLLSDDACGAGHRIRGVTSVSDDVSAFVSGCLNDIDGIQVNVEKCRNWVHEYGAFRSMLPVMIADRLRYDGSPFTLYMDDLNPDGLMVLVEKIS